MALIEVKRNDNAAVYPNSNVGDCLYTWDEDDGMVEYVIIDKDADGHCVVAYFSDPHAIVSYASKRLCHTRQEAMKTQALASIAYYEKQLAYSRAALAAVETGDISAFIDGKSYE